MDHTHTPIIYTTSFYQSEQLHTFDSFSFLTTTVVYCIIIYIIFKLYWCVQYSYFWIFFLLLILFLHSQRQYVIKNTQARKRLTQNKTTVWHFMRTTHRLSKGTKIKASRVIHTIFNIARVLFDMIRVCQVRIYIHIHSLLQWNI